jgi:GT2 family glycosyltransferase
MQAIDISVITVTYESREFVGELIDSVALGAHESAIEHIVIDNGSKDGTAGWVREAYGERVRLIANEDNRGFAAANNQGVALARGKYLLFLNPDMRVEMGSLDRMVGWMKERPDVGIGGCRLLDFQGNPNEALRPRRFPSVWVNLIYLLRLEGVFPGVRDQFHYEGFCDDEEQEVDNLRGAFMMMPREVVEKLGWGFDPRYFILFEDLDLCREVWGLGYRVVYTPVVSCTDYFHRSFVVCSQPWKYRQLTKSIFKYWRKWGPWHAAWVVALATPLGYLLRVREWGWKAALRELGLMR